jgi:hypothetical protein
LKENSINADQNIGAHKIWSLLANVLLKILDNTVYNVKFVFAIYPIFILLLPLVLIFTLITISSSEIQFLNFDFSYSGFAFFSCAYSFALKYLLYSITTWGILVALLKFKQSESQFNEQIQLTRKSIDLSYQPFISIEFTNVSLDILNNISKLIIQCKNSGKYPGTITSFIVTINKNGNVFGPFEIEYLLSVFPDDLKVSNPVLPNLITKDFFVNVTNAEITIKVYYYGFNNIKHELTYKYLYDAVKTRSKLIECDWNIR